ncbi:SDR family oxidoreductase [Enterococcus casseliflavus]|uniref:SDR family oxidoreductase n=1 Tax=Enterococcus casseliflavus TaxID=37734 RepID=UPI001432B31B|nr:SDR family oxidoreductase [Enterococcus casseliflavus]NKD28220.1 SDR family oxidoreductase [Enterococcus casseliflavus]
MKYLVTSAKGDLAFNSVKFLVELVGKEKIAVTVRSLEKAKKLEDLGVEIKIADYFDKASLVTAFQGVNRVLFVSSGELDKRKEQHKNVVEALIEANVDFVAYTSAPNAQKSKAIVAPDHKFTEHLIEESGLEYSFLRNNWYLENEAMLFDAIKNTTTYIYSAGDGKAGWAKKSDYAEGAAKVLAGDFMKKKIYEFSGQSLSYSELASLLQKGKEYKINLDSVTDDEYRRVLETSGFPEGAINFIVGIQKDIREGELETSSTDLEDILGRELKLDIT